MAWRSSGSNNSTLVDNLKRFGVIHTDAVEAAMRKVDRRFFVPRTQTHLAHSDQPLREGHVHISAPHIYGAVLEALEFEQNSSQSFLNIGSGTGYLSCIVANLLGPRSVHVAIEVSCQTMAHARESLQQWKAANLDVEIPPLELIHGNALNIDLQKGEAVTGYDRIYLGAAVPRNKLDRFAQLLRPGGILVGPVEDDLVKVVRVGEDQPVAVPTSPSIPRTLRGQPPMLSSDFSVQVLSGVRFASLVNTPEIPIVLPSRVWTPAQHTRYPDSFRRACQEILLCARSTRVRPVLPVPVSKENAAAILPRSLWLEVLSFTTREWFEQPRSSEDLLRRRLQQEQIALREAREAQQRAEGRLERMERERDLYKLLLLRSQARLRAAVGDRNVPNDDVMEAAEHELPLLLMNRQGDLMRLLRDLVAVDNEGEEEEDDQEDVDIADSDEDEDDQEDAMEDATEGNSMVEEDTSLPYATGPSVGRQQPRTVSMSGEEA